MKKIPTLFTRVFENRRIVGILPEITPGCEEAFKHGIATIKVDGSCCAVIDGVFYKRYDAKKGKKPPVGAIPCCEPDPVTGHHPHWVQIDASNPSDKWFIKAKDWHESIHGPLQDGTYEAIGEHFNGNPYRMRTDTLAKHGAAEIHCIERDFESVKRFLESCHIEGLVFWLNGEPVCKIKRTDFGFEWPVKVSG